MPSAIQKRPRAQRHATDRKAAPRQLCRRAAQLGGPAGRVRCFFFIADWHALTTDYADTRSVKQNSLEVIIDYLAAGLDPERSTLFIQSHVPQHAELHLLFSMITPLGWLERVPSYKEQRENLKDKDLGTYGFLGYPLLQSADILMYQADFVPVGEDQVPHVELTREVARRFNQFYPRKVHAGDRDPQRRQWFFPSRSRC